MQPHHDVREISRYRVHGMDCASCATKIEGAARGVTGVEEVRVSIASQLMSLTTNDAASTAAVERAVTELGYRLDRLDAPEPGGDGALPDDPAHLAPRWAPARWAPATCR